MKTQFEVLIVSKTKMSKGVCVGAIKLDTGDLIRIHNERGANLGFDAPYEIGEIWVVQGEPAWNVRPRPHVEDWQISPCNKSGDAMTLGQMVDRIKQYRLKLGGRFTDGSLRETFEGTLSSRFCMDGTSSVVVRKDRIPSFSTQFWMPDKPLRLMQKGDKSYYIYEASKPPIRIAYVGFQKSVEEIPAGTLVRLSLANWWRQNDNSEECCYLQLSGWYVD